MSIAFRSVFVAVLCICSALAAGATSALAAPPANDLRATPEAIAFPAQVTGTTVEATLEDGEPYSNCGSGSKGSVWYSIEGTGGRLAIVLKAQGDLDAVIDVYERDRSQTETVDCAKTNSYGVGIAAFQTNAGSAYLVRVAERSNSTSGEFQLTTSKGGEPADPPGRKLPRRGVSDTVSPVANPSDAWSVKFRAGVSYRINLATSEENYCIRASLLAPGASSPDDSVTERFSCSGGYTLFTPGRGEGGRYSIVVFSTSRTLAKQRYHLEVARAQRDDTAPGRHWPGKRARGHLSGNGIDVVDLYNWDLRRTAKVDIDVSGGFSVKLIGATGRRFGSGDSISRRLKPGQYYVVVSAEGAGSGRYTLTRKVREITRTRTHFNGSESTIVSPGGSVAVSAEISPSASGRAEITLERYDPQYGWQFDRVFSGRASGGTLARSFNPGGIGRWRAKSKFFGSSTASGSSSHWSYMRVKR